MSLLLTRPKAASERAIRLGLLNNLSNAGLERGERQVVELLAAVAGDHVISLSFFTLTSIERNSKAKARIEAYYAPSAELLRSDLDGLIVTGCEPQTQILPDEPFWAELTEVIDWAEHHTRSTIWSCLAAHAAVLHLDGIERRRLPEKLSGLFRVAAVTPHMLLDGAPNHLLVPHSRWNGLDETDLEAAGYQILTRGELGVDTFVKSWQSLFVFLQGHPEYDAGALAREYRRDVARYLEGTVSRFPKPPSHYFDPPTEAAVNAFATRACQRRDLADVSDLPIREPPKASFPHGFAQGLFRNWLAFLACQSADRLSANSPI